MSSLASTTSIDKAKEESNVGVFPAAARLSSLPGISEKDEVDEGARVAGLERQEVTQDEMDAVGKKLDRRLLPIMALVYFSQFWDKNSLTYSSVMGLPIKGEHYNLVSMAFYLGFLIFEIPSSALAQRLPMAKYLGVNMLLWATVLILHSASPRFGVFFSMRFLLGVFECCVSPILLTYIASFWPKHQQARRVSVFYCMNGLTNMFGGLTAWAVTFYKGTALAHWRIFYFMMGGLAFVVAAIVLLFMPDSIGTAKFLTEREKIVAYERVRDNGTGGRATKLKRSHVIEAVTDGKTWILMLLTALSSIPNGGLASFSSILIKGFGFTSRATLLLQIPRGFVAACTTVTVCFLSDKYSQRMLPILVAVIPTIVGAALMAETYGSALAIQYAWTASNTGGASKKAVVNGMFITVFGAANVVGTQIFRPSVRESAPSPVYQS
ncbi:hypothetical protein JCM10213v2_005451 [Rhodosporidiobolus nylandii]